MWFQEWSQTGCMVVGRKVAGIGLRDISEISGWIQYDAKMQQW